MTVSRNSIIRLAVCGMLVAVGVVLGGALKLPVTLFGAYSLKLSFGMVPVILASLLYGPVYGAMCGAAYDMLGALFFPVGSFNPAFSLVVALMGALPGLLIMRSRRVSFLRLLGAIGVSQLLGSVVLNTALLMLFYGSPIAVIIPRLLTQAIMIPAFTVLCYSLLQATARFPFSIGALPLEWPQRTH